MIFVAIKHVGNYIFCIFTFSYNVFLVIKSVVVGYYAFFIILAFIKKYYIMKKIDFKIIELQYCQVLVSKDFEEDEYLIRVIFFLDNVKTTNKHYYENEQKRDEMFDSANFELIERIVNSHREMFSDK